MNKQEIGQKLRIFRKSHALSRADLAHILHVSTQQVAKYEAGDNRISLNSLMVIAQHLDINLVRLIAHFELPQSEETINFNTFSEQTHETVKLLSLFHHLKPEERSAVLTLTEDLMRRTT